MLGVLGDFDQVFGTDLGDVHHGRSGAVKFRHQITFLEGVANFRNVAKHYPGSVVARQHDHVGKLFPVVGLSRCSDQNLPAAGANAAPGHVKRRLTYGTRHLFQCDAISAECLFGYLDGNLVRANVVHADLRNALYGGQLVAQVSSDFFQ